MEIKKKKEEKKKKLYFCPFCKVFFIDEKDYEYGGKRGYDYKCFDCSEYFNDNTYKEVAGNNKKFHFRNEVIEEDKVGKHIQHIILNLYRRGYSQRKIYSLTHIPKGRIEEVTKKRVVERIITKKTFLLEYLQMSMREYKLLVKKDSGWQLDTVEEDIIDKWIVKAINFGCTYEVMEKLFGISNRRIKKWKDRVEEEGCRKYKVKLVDGSSKMKIEEI